VKSLIVYFSKLALTNCCQMPRAQVRALPSAPRADEAALLTAGRIAALIWNEICTLGNIEVD
jgi:hypothetical protein